MPRPADPRGTRTAAGRRRRRKAAAAGKKVGSRRRCTLGVLASEEEAAVAERLEVLKELVPTDCRWRNGCGGDRESSGAPAMGADRLFEDAAGYIILLRAQVGVLQKLLDVYGASGVEETRDEHTSTG